MNIRKWLVAAAAVLLFFGSSPDSQAAPRWEQVGQHVTQSIDNAVKTYDSGNAEGAKAAVNDAYYGIYEKDGLEPAIRASGSGKRCSVNRISVQQTEKGYEPTEQQCSGSRRSG